MNAVQFVKNWLTKIAAYRHWSYFATTTVLFMACFMGGLLAAVGVRNFGFDVSMAQGMIVLFMVAFGICCSVFSVWALVFIYEARCNHLYGPK